MSLYQHLFYSDFTVHLLSEKQMVSFMIQVELALAKAQEEVEIIPKGVSAQLEDILKKAEIDIEALKRKIPLTGNATAPLVKQLFAICEKENPDAAKYIHLGATSQDILDTATILKIEKYESWLQHSLRELATSLIELASRHQDTLMIGRTLMQQARPITFGLKVANWFQDIEFSRQHLLSIEDQLLTIQLGGAVGSQNEFLPLAVRKAFANILGLHDSPPWHTQRARIAVYASSLGVLAGSLGKIAQDIVYLSQTELGEVMEPNLQGRGTSSTMPHKRNPILSTAILANAQRIPFLVGNILAAIPQSHERAAGSWHMEWETLDQIMGLTAGALEKCLELIQGLEVRKERMRENIDVTHGLIFAEGLALALAQKRGKEQAHELMKKACQQSIQEQQPLREILHKMHLGFSVEELNELFDPAKAIGFSTEIITEMKEQYEYTRQD